MAKYEYSVLDSQSRVISGELTGASEEEISGALKARGYTIVTIDKLEVNRLASFKRGIGIKEKILFSSYLSLMIKAGLPIISGIEVLITDVKSKAFRHILEEIRVSLEKGKSLSQGLALFPNVFDSSYVAIVRSGEASGQLDAVLVSLAEKLKQELELKSRIKGALMYPGVILFTLLIVGLGMMIFVVPKVVGVFSKLDLSLPLPTRILIGVTEILTFNYFLTAGGLITFFSLIIFLLKSHLGQNIMKILLVRMPIVKSITKAIDLARITSLLSILLKSGIPIEQSLEISADVVINPKLRVTLLESVAKVKKGITVAESLDNEKGGVPKIMIKIVDVGERTGSLDDVFKTLSASYQDEVSERLKTFAALLEPILMLFVGMAVGVAVLSIIGPIYQIVGRVGG